MDLVYDIGQIHQLFNESKKSTFFFYKKGSEGVSSNMNSMKCTVNLSVGFRRAESGSYSSQEVGFLIQIFICEGCPKSNYFLKQY
jgi:hypothetical protein